MSSWYLFDKCNSCQVDTILAQGVISKIFGKFTIYFIQGVFTHIITAGQVAVCYGIQFWYYCFIYWLFVDLWLQSVLIVKLN